MKPRADLPPARHLFAASALAACLAASGCASIGPGTVALDRFDYDHAITMSWKRTVA